MKANASAYAQDRVHEVRLPTGYEGDLTANFAAVLAENNPLLEARWHSDDAAVAGFGNGAVEDRQSSVRLRTTRAGTAELRCSASASFGQAHALRYVVHVSGDLATGMTAGSADVVALPIDMF